MGIDPIALAPRPPLPSHHHHLGHVGREELVEPLALLALFDAQVEIASELLQLAHQSAAVRLDHVATNLLP